MYLFGIILRAIKNNIQYLFFIPSSLCKMNVVRLLSLSWALSLSLFAVETQMCVSVSITIIRTQKIIIVTKKKYIGVVVQRERDESNLIHSGVTSVNLLLCAHFWLTEKVTFSIILFLFYFYECACVCVRERGVHFNLMYSCSKQMR